MFLPPWLKSILNRRLDSPSIASYTACFGAYRGLILLFVCLVRPRLKGRVVRVALPDSSTHVLVRLGTTDVAVFNGIYRRKEYEWDLGTSPRVIVDAGAYTGLSATFFATRYPKAKIIAIEPDEHNFSLLTRNTAMFENVHPVRAALWAESGAVSLMDPGDGAWGLRLRESDSLNRTTSGVDNEFTTAAIRGMTVSDVIQDFELDKIDLLKVDIEGSEKEVFAHADSWIDHVQAICVELHDRFSPGCTRAFFNAVEDFPVELWRGEDVLVTRAHR